MQTLNRQDLLHFSLLDHLLRKVLRLLGSKERWQEEMVSSLVADSEVTEVVSVAVAVVAVGSVEIEAVSVAEVAIEVASVVDVVVSEDNELEDMYKRK